MSGDCCRTKILNNVLVQENGIMRNKAGRIIGRLVDDVKFDSPHLEENVVKLDSPSENKEQ